MIRIRTLMLGLAAAMSVIALLIVGLGALVYHTSGLVDREWDELNAGRSPDAQAVYSISKTLGYGGMIHNLKNFVLRREPALAVEARRDLAAAIAIVDDTLQRHQALGVDDKAAEKALDDLRNALLAYDGAIVRARSLANQGHGAAEIDDQIEFDSAAALAGLTVLDGWIEQDVASLGGVLNRPVLLARLYRALGYGGLIHAFKNLVIRQDAATAATVRARYNRLRRIFDHYETLALSDRERGALSILQNTVHAYLEGAEAAEDMISAGSSPEEIDSRLRIDDRMALSSLVVLEGEMNHALELGEAEVDILLARLRELMGNMFWAGPLLIVLMVATTLWILRRHLLLPLLETNAIIRQLATGDLQVEVTGTERQNEIGDIARLLEDFKQTALARAAGERQLREQDVRIRGVLDNVVNGIVTADAAGVVESFNPAAERMFGYAAEEVIGNNVKLLMSPELAERHGEALGRYLETGDARMIGVGPRELMARRKDGSSFPIELAISEMTLVGRRIFVAVLDDISDRKEIEGRLIQAQKMEAVGNLTGGIAHDFNNMLGVVMGNLELLARTLLRDGVGDEKVRRRLESATRAARNGAELTSRLLSFSRRQVLEPRNVDVNELVRGVDDMLRRTLGEQIEVATELADGAWFTRTDPGQLENAILNMAVNARDAMPDGGGLTIEVSNVRIDEAYVRSHPYARVGDYVMLSVSDTGTGIPEETLKHVFEPFFTTKEVGKGTGLGLSMIYGFAKQSGGHVGIYSEVGVGTTVRVYLPRLMDGQASAAHAEGTGLKGLPEGTETVLVVEDNESMRETVIDLLQNLGYTAHTAENGPQALEVLERGDAIDLMLTDMVMPGGMSGRDLIRETRRRRPALKVVLSSGYAFDVAARNDMSEEGVAWIGKPYDLATLAQNVREVLDT